MVAVGSAIFSEIGVALAGPNVDPTRIAAQIVTGVGFLGAGAILRTSGDVKGLTTAASVWVAAAIGMAAGFRLFLLATVMAVVVVLALSGLRPLARRLPRRPD
jgi:putative Mg2+ transporter-C (MgtC) family protein